MEDIGNAVADRIEHRMELISYLAWRQHRDAILRALTILVDMGSTFNMLTILMVAGVPLTTPIDRFVQREVEALVEQGAIQGEAVGVWWDTYKAVSQ